MRTPGHEHQPALGHRELRQDRTGGIYLLGVDPDYQRHGIGTAPTDGAFDRSRAGGMRTVLVETRGDAAGLKENNRDGTIAVAVGDEWSYVERV